MLDSAKDYMPATGKQTHGENGIMTWGYESFTFVWYGDTIWVNYNDLTVLPHWKSWFILGKSSPNGRFIQVSELL
jgi:hypothetical protein